MEGLQYQMLSGGRITEGETNIESLPDELLFDILVRLPADFLHDIARLVCIIRSDAFIKTHFQQYSSCGLVLSLPLHPHAIYVTDKQGQIETSELSCIHRNEIIATSCNGLALQLHKDDFKAYSVHVINPATKQSFLLPSISQHNKSHVYYHQSSIAYSADSMEYKVTLPYRHYDHVQCCLDIVTVGVDKSWRRVEVPPLPECFRYFFLYPLRYCLTMNVETEIFTMTEAPIHPDHDSYYYLSTGRYITLLVSRKELSWEVWEMRPAESGEWRKAVVPNIDLEPQKCRLQQQIGYKRLCLHPVGWVKYPEVLALHNWSLKRTCIFYNLETHEINTIELRHHPHYDYKALVHRNSLVWLTDQD